MAILEIVPYRGIIEIVGGHDVGKTIAMLQTTSTPKDIVFVDDDVKGEGTARQMHEQGLEFDMYLDLAKERLKLGDTPTADELLKHVVMPTIDKITAKHRKVIVWDTWRIVYQSARTHVERNQNKYASVVTFRGTNSIVQGLISKVARMIEVQQLNKLKASCDLLLISHHLKDRWEANVNVGLIPESSATFSEVCNMRIWLRRNPHSKVPIILFLKRPNVPHLSKGKLVFSNIVPLKITPTDKHESIWEAIAEYQSNPIESRAPRPDETPTKEELAAIQNTLTDEQQDFVKSMIAYNLNIEKELAEAQSEVAPTSALEAAGKGYNEGKAASASNTAPSNVVELINAARERLNMSFVDVQSALGRMPTNDTVTEDWKTLSAKGASDEQPAAKQVAKQTKAKSKK